MIVERTNTGYSAYAKDFPVCTTGSNLKELTSNFIEVIDFYFSEMGVARNIHAANELKINLGLPQFFDFYELINAKALSERIGMSLCILSQYITGYKRPSASPTKRILLGVQKIGRELAEIKFILQCMLGRY